MNPLVLYSLVVTAVLASPLKVELQKRSSFVSGNVESTNGFLSYDGEIELGTPPQVLVALFDTGSFNLITTVRSSCSGTSCDYYGAYDPTASHTSINTTDEYSIYYSDGTRGIGYYYRDHLQVAGLEVDDFLFASGSVDDYSNIAGLGYINDSTRSVLPYVFQRNGVIQRSLFSVFSDSTTSTGAIIFGGLDSGKYTGTLETVPVIGTQGWNVYVSGITSECGFSNQNSFEVNVDTGAQVSLLPSSLYHQINQLFGGSLTSDEVYPYGEKVYLFKCSRGKPLTINFSGKIVQLEPQTFILPAVDSNGNELVDVDGDHLCATSFMPTDYSPTIGADLLQNMFLVFDLDNAEVAIAQFTNGEEELIEVIDEIPSATRASEYGLVTEALDNTLYGSASTLSITGASVAISWYQGPFNTDCSVQTTPSLENRDIPGGSVSSTATQTSAERSTSTLFTTLVRTTYSPTCFLCSTSHEVSTSTLFTSVVRTTYIPTCLSCTTSHERSTSTLTTSVVRTTFSAVCLSCPTSESSTSNFSSIYSETCLTCEEQTTVTVETCPGGCTTTLSPPQPTVSNIPNDSSSGSSSSSSSSTSESPSPTISTHVDTSSSTISTHADISSSTISPYISSVTSSTTEITSSSSEVASEFVLTSMNHSTYFLDSSIPPVIEETTLTSSSLVSNSSSTHSYHVTSVVTKLTTVVSETHTKNVTVASVTQCLDCNSSIPAVSTSPTSSSNPPSSGSSFTTLAALPPTSFNDTPNVSDVTSLSSSVDESRSLTKTEPRLTSVAISFSGLTPNEDDITSTITTNILVTEHLSASTDTSISTETSAFATEPTVSTFEGRGSLITASLSLLMFSLFF